MNLSVSRALKRFCCRNELQICVCVAGSYRDEQKLGFTVVLLLVWLQEDWYLQFKLGNNCGDIQEVSFTEGNAI